MPIHHHLIFPSFWRRCDAMALSRSVQNEAEARREEKARLTPSFSTEIPSSISEPYYTLSTEWLIGVQNAPFLANVRAPWFQQLYVTPQAILCLFLVSTHKNQDRDRIFSKRKSTCFTRKESLHTYSTLNNRSD